MPKKIEFSEGNYFAEYKKIRNRFRQYDPILLIKHILEFLYKDYSEESIEQIKKQPWLGMLLIKWIIIDDNFDQKGRKSPDKRVAINLINEMIGLESYVRMPSDYHHLYIFFRLKSFQQFHYQQNFKIIHLGRQIKLFFDEKNNSYFDTLFRNQCGISIIRFFEIAVSLLTAFQTNPGKINFTTQWFSTLNEYIKKEEIDIFFNLLSLDLKETKKYLIESSGKRRPAREYYEQTPLIQQPFLAQNNGFLCWYPTLFYRAIEHFVYDQLKKSQSQKFMKKFGKCFEGYIGELLTYSGNVFLSENDLYTILEKDEKCVDFLLCGDNYNVYIDAKAVETRRDHRCLSESEIISDKINDSIIFAIKQAHYTFKNLDRLRQKFGINEDQKNSQYILVITYKEMYVGSGCDLFEAIANERLQAIHNDYPNKEIPFENMYFITIEEFEFLCELVNRGEISLIDVIRSAIDADNKPETKKFEFKQHIQDIGGGKVPELLKSEANKILENLKGALEHTKGQ